MAINYFGKQLNLSFQRKEVLETKSNLLKKTNYYKMIKILLKKWTIFFKNAVLTLDIKENSHITNYNIPYITDPIEKAIEKYKANSFGFLPVIVNDVEKEIKKLNPNKATTFNTIPFKILIKTSNISA